ncbi:MAG: hypothetical protein ABIR70_05185 [Bryobacteraceae bacterium]
MSKLTVFVLAASFAFAQAPAVDPAKPAAVAGSRTGGLGRGATARPPSDPTPRWPDGHPMLSAAPGKIGFWNAGTGGLTGKGGMNLPTNLEIGEVPFMPWSKALYEERRRDQQKNDPHARCMPPGGPRQFHTPYGLQLYELPEMKRVLILSGGGPRTWREIYLDGRPHPSEDDGDFVHGFLGHSIGKWEGDTLVIDTVGFNEQFWFARAGFPHTESLHLIERISRPDYNTLKYEVTIDDPKAYTKPWTGGHLIYWTPDEDFEEYFCQGNNRDADHLVGQ